MAKRKTTLMLDEGLYDKIRLRAAERRESMSSVVAEGMATYLAEPKKRPEGWRLPVASVPANPFPPGVFDSATAMEEYLESLEAKKD